MSRRVAQTLRKRSVVVAGHRTSVSLEDAFWERLRHIAAERGITASRLIAEIDRHRRANLSSAIRVYVVEWLSARVGGDAPPGGGRQS